MAPRTRYQGAILRDHQILLLKQVSMPAVAATGRFLEAASSRMRPGSSACSGGALWAMREETGLEVQVDTLLLDEPSPSDSIYQRWKTYRCAILAGEARPGCEPEAAYADAYSFTEVGWFDLRHPTAWNERLEADSYIYAWLQRIQEALGYTVAPGLEDHTEGLV